MASDWELLERYAAGRDQEAFAELARRHVDMVYGVARRCLGTGGGAEDVVQAVFLLLSQKAKRIPRRGALAGWLFRATRFCCADVKKREGRRKRHEREAGMQRQEPAAKAEELGAELDAALERLGEKERQAVLVRFLEGKSAAETGAALGISEAAAEKRVERGIAKLRAVLARKGYTIPAAAVMTVLVTEGAKAAPMSAVASAATVTGGAAVAAVGIAKGAALAMKMAAFKMVACVLVLVGVGTGMIVMAAMKGKELPQIATMPTAATAPANEEIKVPGVTQLARWDAVLSEAGAKKLRKLATAVASESKVYQAMTCNAAELRRLVATGIADKSVLQVSGSLQFADERDSGKGVILTFAGNGWSGCNEDRALMVGSKGGLEQDKFERVGTNQVRLTIDHRDVGGVIREDASLNYQKQQAVVYSGDLNAGEAAIFLGKYVGKSGTAYYHLIVWEVFKAERPQMGVVGLQQSARWWCEKGPEVLRKWADVERLWTAQATHGVWQIPAGFEKKLEDGKVVRLVALCRPSKWPGCWWDAQGNPVAGMTRMLDLQGDPSEGLWALVQVRAENAMEEVALSTPMGRNGNSLDDRECDKIAEGRAMEAGVLVGPWKLMGSLYEGQSMTEGGVEYRVDHPLQLGDKSFLVSFRRKGILTNEDYLVPTTVNGATPETYEVARTIVFGPKPATVGPLSECPNFWGMALNEVKEYRIYQRKREWVKFEGFASEPKVTPSVEANMQEVVRAEEVKRAAWRAVPADPKTITGALRVFVTAIQRGDEKGVRAMLAAEKPRNAAQLEGVAHALVVMEQARVMAVERYGERVVEDQLEVPDVEREFIDGEWRLLTQGGNTVSIRTQADGTIVLYLDNAIGEDAFAERVRVMTAWGEKLKRLLTEHREMTVDELVAAMQRTAEAPATQRQ